MSYSVAPTGEIRLEGVLQLPDAAARPVPAVVVCHPHPQMGGDMDNTVVRTICDALMRRGIASLRFNFRGAGASSGEYDGGVGERDDVWASLDLLRARPDLDAGRLGLAGYSFGAAVALNACAAAGVKALVAVSPPLRMLDFSAQLGVDFPLLLVAGDRDPYVQVDRLRQFALAAGERASVAIIAGADHFWGGAGRQLGETTGDFFASHLGVAVPESG